MHVKSIKYVHRLDKYVVMKKSKENVNCELMVVVPVEFLGYVRCNQQSTENDIVELDGWLLRLVVILNSMTCCHRIPG